ncbi:MAG TPA: hypothetical protein VK629_20570 [Steroidobacteraceae bacterium]|nr:hypothetical protein [Steroidobacteraceae bacterium]
MAFFVASDADAGLICGFILSTARPPRELDVDDFDAVLAVPDSITWLHFNQSDARARHLLASAAFVPEDVKEMFRHDDLHHDLHGRVEALDSGHW